MKDRLRQLAGIITEETNNSFDSFVNDVVEKLNVRAKSLHGSKFFEDGWRVKKNVKFFTLHIDEFEIWVKFVDKNNSVSVSFGEDGVFIDDFTDTAPFNAEDTANKIIKKILR